MSDKKDSKESLLTPDVNITENFIYLGLSNNIHFFLNIVANSLTTDNINKISSDVYNFMIQESMIKLDQSCIVYNIHNLATGSITITAVLTTHSTFKKITIENTTVLIKILSRFVNMDRSKDTQIMVICATLKKDVSCFFNMYIISSANDLSDMRTKIKSLHQVMPSNLLSIPLTRFISSKPLTKS